MESKPTIGLALGGGAAYGMSHIGVLQTFIDSGINIDYIVGTSAGAIAGALYATGYDLKKFETEAINFKNKDVASLNLLTMLSKGVLSDKKAMALFRKYLGYTKIEECRCGFAAVATDIISGNAQYICKGDMAKAIRASISIPGIFEPIKYENKLLVDGSVSDNLPYDYLKRKGVDIIIAVDVCGNYTTSRKLNNVIKLFCQAMELLQVNKEKQRRKCYDFKIQVNNYGGRQMSLDKETTERMIFAGREAAIGVIPDIKKYIEEKSKENLQGLVKTTYADELVNFSEIKENSRKGLLYADVDFANVKAKNKTKLVKQEKTIEDGGALL